MKTGVITAVSQTRKLIVISFSVIPGLSNGLRVLFLLIGSWSVCWFGLAEGWQCRMDLVWPLTILSLGSIICHVLAARNQRESVRKALMVWKEQLIANPTLGLVGEFQILSTEKLVLLEILMSRGKGGGPGFRPDSWWMDISQGSLLRRVRVCCPPCGSRG